LLRREFFSASTFALGLAAPSVASAGSIPAAKSILDYGARPDGRTLNTQAIQRAIDDVFQAGGGLVYAPPGTFLIGGLELKSRVTLYLEAGCVLLGSTSIGDYAYRPGASMWGDANGHHVIFAHDADDVTLCGPGTINGQGSAYWRNIHRLPPAEEDLWQDCVAFDYKPIDNHRPSPMLEFAMCRNLKISGVTLTGSAGWTLRPIACETVVIDGIRIRNPDYGSNTDGIDITCCRNVKVSNCDISTGDDAICLKSENPYGGMLPTKNITITNCILTTSCNGFKMGTATHGSFENIVFSNSVIYNDESSPLNARVMGGIAVEMVDGGSVDGVVVSNIRMQNVRAPIFVRLAHRTGNAEGSFLRNVLIDGIDATGAVITSSIMGISGLRPRDITVSNSRIRTSANGTAAWAKLNPPELPATYPESRLFGHFPSYGFYIRHADRVRLRDIELIADKPDERPAMICEDVEDVILSGLDASAPVGGAPLIDLKSTRRAFLTGMRAPANAAVFAQIGGADSSAIALTGISTGPQQEAVRYVDGATADSTTKME
jgi:polygalacturonase